MERKISIIARAVLILTAIMVTFNSLAIGKQTVRYAEKDGQTLLLDHYAADIQGPRPCVIFAFGGGFTSGTRDEERYRRYFWNLVRHGYDVVSIDYRLEFARKEKTSVFNMVGRYERAIVMAAEDMLSAAAYVVEHSQDWNIDTTRIYATGSSAGAIASLQAEYKLCNEGTAAFSLPEKFNFAGVIAFAGAIFTRNGVPEWKTKPCPFLFFHGNADNQVPYGTTSLFGIGLYGPEALIPNISEAGGSFYFHSAMYRNHDMATEPMTRCGREILNFIADYTVPGHDCFRITRTIWETKYPECKTSFSLLDYLSHDYSK